jgi:hypothetical protein
LRNSSTARLFRDRLIAGDEHAGAAPPQDARMIIAGRVN